MASIKNDAATKYRPDLSDIWEISAPLEHDGAFYVPFKRFMIGAQEL